MKFKIGPGVECDAEVLLRGRGLFQAMSGAGKSWALRRFLEQLAGILQLLVIDCEGDFKTLREKFPFVLVAAEGGDAVASPASARAMALKLLELGVSAILDISGLGMDDQEFFVAEFLRGLMYAPQKLWHDALIVVDEAQVFAPQGRKTESKTALTDAAPRFRKRGFGLLLATPALAQLDKRVSEMCANKLIGRSMFVDAERAARELGMPELRTEMRSLADGEWYAFGPAISKEVVKVHIGPVQTTHPSPGGRSLVAPPAPEQVQAILSQLSELVSAPEEPKDAAGKIPVKSAPQDERVKALERQVAELQEAHGRLATEKGKVAEKLASVQRDLKGAQVMGLAADELRAALVSFLALEGGGGQAFAGELDLDALAAQVAARLPARNGSGPVVTLAPAPLLRKKYLELAAQRLYERVAGATPAMRQAMEYVIGQGVFCSVSKVTVALTGNDSGGSRDRYKKALDELLTIGLVEKGGSGRSEYKANIEAGVAVALNAHAPSEEEVVAVAGKVSHLLAGAGVSLGEGGG